jgi:hypothetical protein
VAQLAIVLDKNFDAIKEMIDKILQDLAERPDRALLERLFEKFKSSLDNVAQLVNRGSLDDRVYATVDDLKRLEQIVLSITKDFDEAAAARKSSCCLSCGRPYRNCTGAIQDEETAQVLGAAPISRFMNDVQKPCFVYGTDHELYYASSPRPRTFAAPPTTGASKSRAKQ